MDAVGELGLRLVRVNERGNGDASDPPSCLRGLLIYGSATGGFLGEWSTECGDGSEPGGEEAGKRADREELGSKWVGELWQIHH